MDKKTSENRDRKFPWKCVRCGERLVEPDRFPYTTEFLHNDRVYVVTIPDLEAPRCRNCGAIVLTDAANDRIDTAFRAQAQLLQPEEIRRQREALGVTQAELAAHMGVSEATVARWETGGQIQPHALDRLLRVYFEFPPARGRLQQLAEATRHCDSQPIPSA
jgi:putative zinc finger/helix-turn-helix YgiT family protein